MSALEPLLSVREIAACLGVSKPTVYKLCADGKLPHFRLNNSIRVSRPDFERFMEASRA